MGLNMNIDCIFFNADDGSCLNAAKILEVKDHINSAHLLQEKAYGKSPKLMCFHKDSLPCEQRVLRSPYKIELPNYDSILGYPVVTADKLIPESYQNEIIKSIENSSWIKGFIGTKRKRAFISGPYRGKTHAETYRNIEKARDCAVEYWKKGYTVICPHKNSEWMSGECEEAGFLEGYLDLLSICHLVVFLYKWWESSGAKGEQKQTMELDIPRIYRGIGEDNIIRTNENDDNFYKIQK